MDSYDADIVARLKQRDPEALEAMIDLYGKRILGLVSRILFGTLKKEDIEECVSDVFIAAWHKIDEFDPGKGPLHTWLYMLAKFKALDYRRKVSAKPIFESLDIETVNGFNTEHEILMKEETDELIRMIDTLNEVDRTIVYMRYYFYESLDTIAKALGLTRKAVENRLSRSRKTLRGRLQPIVREEWS